VRLPRRAEVARFLAPAAFLLAVTIAVLLVRAGLRGGGATTTTRAPQPQPIATRSTTTTRPKPKPAARRFYTIQSGDTLETVAAKFGTTTQKLLALNPTIDPHALSIGQKIRIG
jgi:peptidoglycan DL-endopeptidase LytE